MNGEKTLPMGAAIVTGAAQGIGFAVAERLGRVGQPVAVVGRTESKVARAVDLLTQGGCTVLGVPADVADPNDVATVVARTIERFGGIQAIVNNAGVFEEAPFLDLTVEDWRRTIDINLTGAFLMSQAGARHMGRDGRIVNVSSISGYVAEPHLAAYVASKTGLIGLTRSMAVDLAARGIVANCVAPGWVATDMTRDYLASWTREDFMKVNVAGRAAEPSEVAELVAFLCRADISFITGETILIDGGQTMMATIPGQGT